MKTCTVSPFLIRRGEKSTTLSPKTKAQAKAVAVGFRTGAKAAVFSEVSEAAFSEVSEWVAKVDAGEITTKNVESEECILRGGGD